MYPTSSAFNDALVATSRTIRQRVEVLQRGLVVKELATLIDGAVVCEDTTIRRTGSFTLLDDTGELTPGAATDLLTPRGTEVRPYKGLLLPDGSREYVPLGTLGITSPNVDFQKGQLKISFSGSDRARAIQRRRFTAPWVVAKNTVYSTAIRAIMDAKAPTYPLSISASTGDTSTEVVFERLGDPWDAIQQLARADGCDAYFDALGTFICRPVPDPQSQPVAWTYERGLDNLMLSDNREFTDEQTYSGVSVVVEHPDQDPIRVDVWDTDPASPTYYLGDFGAVPYGFHTTLLSTVEQATMAGTTLLRKVKGLIEKVQIVSAGHFGHDVGDPVRIVQPRSRLNGLYVVDRVAQPLRTGSMTLRMRGQDLGA